jgi:hypothetical protein
MVGNNPIVMVGTKLDLLPEGCHSKELSEWLMEACMRKKLNVTSVHLVSSHSGEGVDGWIDKQIRHHITIQPDYPSPSSDNHHHLLS